MPSLYAYRLFVSHAWSYNESYDRLISLLEGAPYFDYRNYSVPKSAAFDKMSNAQLKSELQGQISPVQCVIVLAGMYVSHSDWIQYEIDVAKNQGKPILGVVPWGAERTPAAVQDAANEMVNWSTASITAAVRKLVP